MNGIFTFSNRLEILFEALLPHLYAEKEDPFSRILIVVPSIAMKTWMMQEASKIAGIAFGFEILLVNEAIQKISLPSKNYCLSRVELAAFIENQTGKKAKTTLEIADLFLKYGEHGNSVLSKPADPSWQWELWQKIPLSLAEYIDQLKPISTPFKLHLFGFSYLSEIKQKFFEKYAHHFWILSPSRMLWCDHRSLKEQYFLTKKLEKEGFKYSQIEELQEYLEESNPLIGNNGRLGRKWRENIEDSLSFSVEIYGISNLHEEKDIEGIYPFFSSRKELLEMLQGDLALLYKREEPLFLSPDDRSIQIHSAPSRYREIEALYDTLLEACQTTTPGNIIVMAPSLESYIPFITTVFARTESQLPFEILERTCLAESSYVQTFFKGIELKDSRWALASVFDLIESPHFSFKNKLTHSDILNVKDLLFRENVTWGIDQGHREKILQKQLIEKGNYGSFSGGIETLLKSLIFDSKHPISATESENLSRFLEVFYALQKEYSFLEWIDTFLNRYEDANDQEQLKTLIRKMPSDVKKESQIFYLKTLAEEAPPLAKSRNLQAIRFCPLLPMRSIPADVIALLGMNNEAFPKIERKSPFSIGTPLTYMPTSTDYDRYLFLESLLSSRKKWILSYRNSETDAPSSLIQETLHYLDQNYRIGNSLPSEALVFHHPELPFDPKYFIKGSKMRSSFGYKKTLQKQQQENPLYFPPPKAVDRTLLPAHLTLDELKRAFHHPIKYHYNKAHGIYFNKKEEVHPAMEEFSSEKLWESEWLKIALKIPIEEVVELAEKEGKFPIEPFKSAAKESFRKNLKEWKRLLVDYGEVFEVEFSYDPIHKKPPVEIFYHGKKIMITGTLPYVSKKGLISFSDPSNLTAIIPEMILAKELPINPSVYFVKKNKEVKFGELPSTILLDHYLRSLNQLTPHLPSWIAPILQEDHKQLKKAILESMENRFKEDLYLKWANIEKIDCKQLIADWKPETEALFGALNETI